MATVFHESCPGCLIALPAPQVRPAVASAAKTVGDTSAAAYESVAKGVGQAQVRHVNAFASLYPAFIRVQPHADGHHKGGGTQLRVVCRVGREKGGLRRRLRIKPAG